MRHTFLAMALGVAFVGLLLAGLELTVVASAVHECDTLGAADACTEAAEHPILATWIRH